MKFPVPEVLFGALLTVAVFSCGAVIGLGLSQRPVGNEPTQSLWIPTDSIGLYTMVLAGFTLLLVIVSGLQGYFLLQAETSSEIFRP